MVIPACKLNEIRNSLNRKSTVHILQHAGYKIYSGHKLKLREEKSASTSIRREDGFIKDFGGDFSGDLIDLLMKYHAMSFEEAVRYIATCLGIDL